MAKFETKPKVRYENESWYVSMCMTAGDLKWKETIKVCCTINHLIIIYYNCKPYFFSLKTPEQCINQENRSLILNFPPPWDVTSFIPLWFINKASVSSIILALNDKCWKNWNNIDLRHFFYPLTFNYITRQPQTEHVHWNLEAEVNVCNLRVVVELVNRCQV